MKYMNIYIHQNIHQVFKNNAVRFCEQRIVLKNSPENCGSELADILSKKKRVNLF